MDNSKKCICLNGGVFLSKNEGLNGCMITVVLLNPIEKQRYKKGHNGKQEKQENYQKTSQKMTF